MRGSEVGVQQPPGCAGCWVSCRGYSRGRGTQGRGAQSRFVPEVALGLENRRECVGVERGGVVLTAALG